MPNTGTKIKEFSKPLPHSYAVIDTGDQMAKILKKVQSLGIQQDAHYKDVHGNCSNSAGEGAVYSSCHQGGVGIAKEKEEY